MDILVIAMRLLLGINLIFGALALGVVLIEGNNPLWICLFSVQCLSLLGQFFILWRSR